MNTPLIDESAQEQRNLIANTMPPMWSIDQIGPLDPRIVEWCCGFASRRIIGLVGFDDLFSWDGKKLIQEPRSHYRIVLGLDGTPGMIIRKSMPEDLKTGIANALKPEPLF